MWFPEAWREQRKTGLVQARQQRLHLTKTENVAVRSPTRQLPQQSAASDQSRFHHRDGNLIGSELVAIKFVIVQTEDFTTAVSELLPADKYNLAAQFKIHNQN